MKLVLVFCVSLLYLTSPDLPGNNLVSIRDQYLMAVESRQQNEQFIRTLEKQPRTAVINGYLAGSHFIKASHAITPWTKWNEFKTGKKLLEQAILSAPSEPELRFIRVTIQANLPGFLNYSADVKHDNDFLRAALPSMRDPDLHRRVTNWLKQQ